MYESGWWNIHPTVAQFSQVTKTLQANLAQWVQSYTSQGNIDLCNLPPPNIIFKAAPFETLACHTMHTFPTPLCCMLWMTIILIWLLSIIRLSIQAQLLKLGAADCQCPQLWKLALLQLRKVLSLMINLNAFGKKMTALSRKWLHYKNN
ncbi:hypothetical protein ACA910_002553 [Epithemia clementina (nom. ined.)]